MTDHFTLLLPRADPPCDKCRSDEPHPFRVQLRPDEGPSWWVDVNAIGRNDAKGLARQKAWDAGEDASPIVVEHAA